MKISVRLNGRVTSVQVRPSVASLYCVVTGELNMPEDKCVNHVQDAVYDIVSSWDGNGKGLGSFVTDKLIEGILEGEELREYNRFLQVVT